MREIRTTRLLPAFFCIQYSCDHTHFSNSGVTMLADGEAAFIGLFVIFAILVFLGIGAAQGVFGVMY